MVAEIFYCKIYSTVAMRGRKECNKLIAHVTLDVLQRYSYVTVVRTRRVHVYSKWQAGPGVAAVAQLVACKKRYKS